MERRENNLLQEENKSPFNLDDLLVSETEQAIQNLGLKLKPEVISVKEDLKIKFDKQQLFEL